MARTLLKGLPVSPGIAIGNLLIARDAHIYEKRAIADSEIETEIAAINKASEQVYEELSETLRNVPAHLSEYREIIAAQMELAHDRKIMDGIRARIKHRKICAAWALSDTIEELCAFFQGMADPYLCDRAQDIRLIGQCLGDNLGGIKNNFTQGPNDILAAFDLVPSDLLSLKLEGVQGIVTVEGGSTSHTAILARGLKVPAVIGLDKLFEAARPEETVIIDGLTGEALFHPNESELLFYRRKKINYENFEKHSLQSARLSATTVDNILIPVCANFENPSQLNSFAPSGAEGIGLYRTEFSYLNNAIPTEESLVKEYETVLKQVSPDKVIFRTLDVGADKILPAQEALHEPNPALGLRGIRFCLYRKDIFHTQLRALLRAAHNDAVSIMLPMVSTLDEVRESRKLIDNARQELFSQGIPHADKIELGVMIETPAAVLISDSLAKECDFFSIGTNDLLHYLMAIDRNNRHVAYLHEPFHPAFARALKQIIDSAHKGGIPVSVCGELASDPYGIALLLGLDIDELSAAPRFIPSIKHLIRHLKVSACKTLARAAIEEFNPDRIHKILKETFSSVPHMDLSLHNTLTNQLR